MMSYQIRTIDLPTGVHSYLDIGKGKNTLLLLHGLSFRESLYPIVDCLKSDFRIIVPDLPFAQAQKFNTVHHPDFYVVYILSLLEKLNLRSVSLFGNSFGGTLAMMCCIKGPQYFDKLIIRCPFWTSAQLPIYLRLKPVTHFLKWISIKKFLSSIILSQIFRLSDKHSSIERKTEILWNRKQFHVNFPGYSCQINPANINEFFGNLISVDLDDRLETISHNTLVLWSAKDSLLESQWAGKRFQKLENFDFIEIMMEYHNISTIDVYAFSKMVLEFVSGNVGS